MIKRIILITLVTLLLSVSVPVFAQGNPARTQKFDKKAWAGSEMIKGEIISIDSVKHKIAIKQKTTGTDKIFKVDPKEIALLKVGEMVRIKVKPGTDVVESIKLVAAKKK